MPKNFPLYLIISKHRRAGKGVSPEFRTDEFSVLDYLLRCLEFSHFSLSLLLHPGRAGCGLEPAFRSTASAHDVTSAIPPHGDQATLTMAPPLPASRVPSSSIGGSRGIRG